MKILFLSDDFPPESFGGAGISTYDLAIGMKVAGHDVSVITTCRNKSEEGKTEYQGLTIYKVASDYPTRWRAYVGLYNRPLVRKVDALLKNIRPDVVHANNIHLYLSYHSLKVAKRWAKAVVFTARDVMTFNYGKLNTDRYFKNFDGRTTWRDHIKQAKKKWNPFRNILIKRYLRYPDKLLAVSQALVTALEQNGIKNVDVMHTGINVDLWQADQSARDRYREKYNLVGKKVILFGGRLSEAKGGRVTLEALSMVVKSVPGVVLLVVSKVDGYSDYMKKEAEKIGMGDRLIFTGWTERDEIKYTYSCADLVLVPSLCFDALPRIVLEAMAAGKPVVGTCYGGAPEAIADGVTGYVVNPFNVGEMAEKIVSILTDSQKEDRFGRAGYERANTAFNSRDKVKDTVEVYQKLINAQ